MRTIGCAGFPFPPTRYFKDFGYVEIQETHLSMPGSGTVRRWRREAPEDFEFAVMAPRELGAAGYRDTEASQTALDQLKEVITVLGATRVVVQAPPEFTDTKTNRAAIKAFFASKHDELPPMVFEAPASWDVAAAEKLALDAQVMPCRDPLAHGLSKAKEVYYRLAGPAGHKSRYEDAPLEALAELARKAKHDRVFYIFSNVDMGQDAKRLQKALGGA
jgi:uncharacterized protein YecE (DUF72 family)